MKIRFQQLKIALRERTNIVNKAVPAWETPILEAVHSTDGISMVEQLGDVVMERFDLSSAAEYQRLANLYGETSEGIPFVAAVYGQHQAGVNALRQAMQASVLDSETPVTPPPAQPKLAKDVYDVIKPDIIAGVAQERAAAQARIAAAQAQAAELVASAPAHVEASELIA